MHQIVYVELKGEGTVAWRPVNATHVGGELRRLPASAADDETWEFEPGNLVRCTRRAFEDNSVCLVAVEAAN